MLHVDTIWSALADDLLRYVQRRVGDRQTAEDLVQEIFVRVQAHRGALRERDRVAPWVFRIARSVVVDHLRARDRQRTVALQAEPRSETGHEPETEDDAQRASRVALGAWLRLMIDSLPPHYAEAVRLADLEGVSQAEAARRLGLSHSGFKSRVQRGRAQLRDILDACCAVELDARRGVMEVVPRACEGDECC
ncbi:MAG: sigma-70 family RNA polymerase sigma factor [Nannocystaceae bacterium]|nr:sigma-70 family RNA polymerase sigma factor [bacterium]